MKKFLTLILSLTLMFSAFTLVACGGEGSGTGGGDKPGDVTTIEGTVGLTYKINGQGDEQYATFTGLSKSCTATEIVVASHYQGVLVTQIGTGYSVLSNFDNVEKITIHKYVNIINASAFWKSDSLKEVNFDKDGVLDKVGSTAALLIYSIQSDTTEVILATESGILHEMQKSAPNKTFIPVPPADSSCACNECNYMRLITLQKLYNCLKYEWPEIEVDSEVAEKAIRPIQKMLEISEKLGL